MPLSRLFKASYGDLQTELRVILNAIVNAIVEGLCGLDAAGNVTFCNDTFLRVTGYRTEEIIGNSLHELVHHSRPDGTKCVAAECALVKVIPYRQPIHVLREFLWRKDGTRFPAEYRAHPLQQLSSATVYVVTIQDMSEREQARNVLRQREEKFRRILVSMTDVAWTSDRDGRMIYISPKVEAVLGYTKQEICAAGTSLRLGLIHPEDFGRVNRGYRALFENQSAYDEEYRIQRKDGAWIWIHDRASGTYVENGVLRADGVFGDITKRRRAEEELYQSRQMLQSILDAIPQRVFWKDRNSVYLGCNRAFARDAGLDAPAAIIGKNDFDLTWKQVADLYRADDKLVMEQGLPKLNFQERQSRPDGSAWWLQTNKLPLLDRDGKVTGVLGTYEDITERKRVEMEFRLTQFSMEHASDAVEWIDSEGRILYVNQAECRALGRSREEVLSLSIPDIDPLFSKEVWRAFWNDLKARGSMTFETRRRSKPERVFPVEVTATYLEFDGQEYCFALLRDMTERKRADRELRMTKSSLENTSDTLLWIDAQSRILYANDAVCRSLGYSREEILSMSITDIDPHFPREGWAAFWEECKTKGSKTFEAHNKTKQGRVFPVEVTANYLEFDGQEYCFAFARDISERRELESQLRHAQKLEGIGQLSSGIAHEINTPIQFVADNLTFLRDSWKSTHELLERYRGAIQNAAEMTLSAEVRAALKQAEQECDWEFIVAEVPRAIDQGLDGAHRVAKIVRAMKEFSHPDSAEKTATDLNKAIESTITVARNEWKYVAELITNLDVNLPAVVCYPGDINQVILNLVVNGAHAIKEKVKDGEKGRITVCTRMRGEFAEISIADTGTGIPEAIRSRVFDPFFTTKEVGKGTGQGLSLAHAVVVKKHSGKIWFETEVGVGTTFFIDLPIKLADPVGKK